MASPSSAIQSQMLATLRLISPVLAMNVAKCRVGGLEDGGYVMLDDLDCLGICYSLGVGPDVSWDCEMAERGAHVYQYDHTVQKAPADHPHFHHFRVGITHDSSLAPDFKRIDTLIEENGHDDRDDMVLKIDIEGNEWDSLDALDSAVFTKFRQILAEFHGMRMLNIESFRNRAHRVFSKIRQTHEVIHVHGNNFGGMHIVEGIPIADCIELSFASHKSYSFAPSFDIFPGHLDCANNSNIPDLFLGPFKF
jgi:Methyltransferase FkbM domain